MPHGIFDTHAGMYDRWFDDHPAAYRQELEIIGRVAGVRGGDGEGSSEPDPGATRHQAGCDLEIGVGTGRFAAPLGIRLGLDPSLPMLLMARARGVGVIRGIAEALPFRDASMGSILVMTSLCYFDDPRLAFREILRILVPGGRLAIGFLGRGGEIAERYRRTEDKGTFLAHATFYTPAEVRSMLREAGFSDVMEATGGITPVKGFSVMTARRPVRVCSGP
jgi:SAM-dependent methyltransferase